jgi:hypothetical protein
MGRVVYGVSCHGVVSFHGDGYHGANCHRARCHGGSQYGDEINGASYPLTLIQLMSGKTVESLGYAKSDLDHPGLYLPCLVNQGIF